MSAARYVLSRMKRDGRLAYLLGPGSEAFDQLTAEVAALDGVPVEEFRRNVERDLRYEPWPSESEILDRVDAILAERAAA